LLRFDLDTKTNSSACGLPGITPLHYFLQVVKETIDPSASVEFKPNTADDPHMRKPNISKAKSLLHWEPKVSLRQGLPRMVSDFQKRILDEK
jgi:UDP-glucuronate decarboxylase